MVAGPQMENKRLWMFRSGAFYIVYSIGPDFIDNGGTSQLSNAGETEHYDIVFTVERLGS